MRLSLGRARSYLTKKTAESQVKLAYAVDIQVSMKHRGFAVLF